MTSVTCNFSRFPTFSRELYKEAIDKIKSFKPSLATPNEKVDGALRTVSRLGDLAGIIAGVGDSFATIGIATEKVAAWTTPLLLTGVALRAAGLAFTTKSFIETHVFLKRFKTVSSLEKPASEYGFKDFSNAVNFISSKSHVEKSVIKKHLNVDREKLIARLSHIKLKADLVFTSSDTGKKEKYQKKLKNIVTLIDKRLKVMKQSKAFLITASVISIVATIALLCSPASPVGFVLVGIVTASEIAHFLKMRQLKNQFEKALKINQYRDFL